MATNAATQPEGHLLVNTIKAVLEGRATNADLQQILDASRKGLSEQISDFHSTIDELRPETRDGAVGLVEAADETFGFMEAALGEIETFLKSGDENLLYSAGSVVRRGADQLNIIFNELRNYVLAGEGPSPFANLNLLIRALDVFTPEMDAKAERLQEFVNIERLRAISALDQLETAEKTPENEGLNDAWDQHLRCMNRLHAAAEKADRAAAETEMKNAEVTFARLAERVPSASMAQRLKGPTPSEQVNLVLSLAEDVANQRVTDMPLVEALQGIHVDVGQTRTELDSLLEAGAVESVLLREEMERALSAIETQQEALAEFAEFFSNRLTEVLRAAAEKLKESAISLGASLDKMGELADRENKVVCIRCGHYNPKGRNNCEKCSAPLPQLSAEGTSTFEGGETLPQAQAEEGPVLSPNLIRIYNAVNAVAEGKIEKDAFKSEIEWFQAQIEANSEYEIEEPDWDAMNDDDKAAAEEGFEAMQKVQEAFAQGVGEMNEALECFRRYLDTDDRSDLEDGVRIMDSGARKIAAVQKATGENK